MPDSPPTRRYFTEAARIAAAAARKVKQEAPDAFGKPELFIVKAGTHAFTWELRRFGGVVLQRGPEAFPSQTLARADGMLALAALCASPDLPTFKRELRP
ncbi:hypothetical protein [Lichenibacterium dinghuense]|uniref:hypothetical protein n=1 Tax=Lichenibacterium dinghuense TaxID=2895977 RepID=UPI001F1A2685|nr:hypothetical protein [Lichenibacterium sp. 6Y81]